MNFDFHAALALGLPIGIGVAAIGSGIGLGLIGQGAMPRRAAIDGLLRRQL